jgi:hypothetical protein
MTTHHVWKASTMLGPNPPQRPHSHRRLGSAAVGAVLVVLALTGCTSDTPDPAATASAAPSAALSGAPNAAAFREIRACLEAAGLDTSDVPSGAPSGMPSGRPSGMPTGAPSDVPSGPPPGMPSGGPDGGAGGGGSPMNLGPEAQAALVACGITMPSRPPAGAATPAPSATP